MTLLVIAAGFLDLYNLLMTQPAFSEWASRYNPRLSGRTLKNIFKRKVLKESYGVAFVFMEKCSSYAGRTIGKMDKSVMQIDLISCLLMANVKLVCVFGYPRMAFK